MGTTYPRPPIPLISHSPPVQGCRNLSHELSYSRVKGAVLVLARNKDLPEILATLDNFEKKFNGAFRYPYVFLNNQQFSRHFEDEVRKRIGQGRDVEFGTIPKEWWSVPEWVGEETAREKFREQGQAGVQYGEKESYHHMCRFYSGLFTRHPLLARYDWYWRLEPGVRFYCDITYDPFRLLALRNMVYGFVITIKETPNTILTLFQTILDYRDRNISNSTLAKRSDLWDFFQKDRHAAPGHEEYNLCHFWTNFEIGDLRFFRSKEYQTLFDHLDRAGGFYLERWGDAPIRSLALGLLGSYDKVHYFEDLAYKHDLFLHCPSAESGLGCRCECPAYGDGNVDIDRDKKYTCVARWKEGDLMW